MTPLQALSLKGAGSTSSSLFAACHETMNRGPLAHAEPSQRPSVALRVTRSSSVTYVVPTGRGPLM